VVITGVGPDSLGEGLALAIGGQNPSSLILASRTESKVQQIAHKVQQLSPSTSVVPVVLDLSSQKAIRAAVSQIQGLVDRVDILINNAGVVVLDHQFTEDGIEKQFGTNHVGHFLFTNLLMPQLKTAASASPRGATRIINVTSAGHRLSPIRFHDYNFEGKEIPPEERPPDGLPAMFNPTTNGYNGWLAYGQSKSANILFSVYLTQRLQSAGIVSYSVHPGCKYLLPLSKLCMDSEAYELLNSNPHGLESEPRRDGQRDHEENQCGVEGSGSRGCNHARGCI
jgi:NAD(P)-dependent dehydrogenase (short-subunit alcohol dehydrogenase family)